MNPQGGFGVHPPCGSPAFGSTLVHWPALPITLQAMHRPQLMEKQQTPSMQLPLSHSVPPPHSWPSRFLPHELLMQKLPDAQSPSILQVELQPVPAQANGMHFCVPPDRQVPLPSQEPGRLAVIASLHDGSVHWVPIV